jgi:hypothetical protein
MNPPENLPTVRKKRSFRINAKCFFLTFPKCGLKLSQLPDVMSRILEGGDVSPDEVCLAYELHKDGTPHIHIFLKYATRRDITNPHAFDWIVPDHHANVQSCRSRKRTLAYITKDNKYLLHGIHDSEIRGFLSGTDALVAFIQENPDFTTVLKAYPVAAFRQMTNVQKLITHVRVSRQRGVLTPMSWPESNSVIDSLYPPMSPLIPKYKEFLAFLYLNLTKPRKHRQKHLYISSPGGFGKSLFFYRLSQHYSTWYAPTLESFFDSYNDDVTICVMDEYRSTYPITLTRS